MVSGSLTLVFPQWQGSGKRKFLYEGAGLIRGQLPEAAQYEEVKVSLEEDIKLEKGIWEYRQIHDQLKNACDTITRESPEGYFLISRSAGPNWRQSHILTNYTMATWPYYGWMRTAT